MICWNSNSDILKHNFQNIPRGQHQKVIENKIEKWKLDFQKDTTGHELDLKKTERLQWVYGDAHVARRSTKVAWEFL